ncbi:MAG: DEAD/DEAH box helicase [Deltaproteobacteria bacterium]|nr:DEAD/DEAH box helicase [Deltaproteobacteria bacterium]
MGTTTDSSSGAADDSAEQTPSFDSLPLSDELRTALREMDYLVPTPVQLAIWEPATGTRDVVCQARTGTGKTAAFGLPMLDRQVKRSQKVVQALVLCPTRELALQVARELEALAKYLEIGITAVYGGAPIGRQIDAIEAGAQIVVGTPGRVLDHLRRGTMSAKAIHALVLDESDEMLSMGFERELTAIIEHLPPDRQTMLFSATLPPDIERIVRTRLNEPEFVILSGDHIGALEVDHFVYFVTRDKLGALLSVLEIEDPESALIFCNTRIQTEQLALHLRRQGLEADWLNGDLPQSDREKVMRRTREGKLRFLVATDVASRGIDVSHLTHVINFDFPQDAEGYVHRTGRTGRAGRTGTAISLITPQEVGSLYILRLTYRIRPIERQLPSSREQRTRLEADIITSLAETFAAQGRDPHHQALARRLLTHDEAEAVIAGMLRAHLTAHPELPEIAQSRRRAKMPPPVRGESEDGASRPARGDRGRRSEPRPPRRERSERERPDRERPDRERPRRERPDGERPDRSSEPEQPAAAEPPEPPAADQRAVPSEPPPEPPAEPKIEAVAPAPVVADTKDRQTAAGPTSGEPSAEDYAVADEVAPKPAPRTRRTRRTSSESSDESPPPKRSKPGPSAPRKSRPSAPRKSRPSAPRKSSSRATEEAEAESPDTIELHVDVGRRGGARVRLLKTILADGGVGPEHVHRVRIREHYCFVELDQDQDDAAIDALTGATIGEHTITASVSERSGS